MDFRRSLPHPKLRGVVRSFGERRGSLGSTVVSWPLPARPHQIIDIYLREPLRTSFLGGPVQTAPETVVVGPQASRRIHIHVSGELQVFNILLQPAALNRLIGIDMSALVNEGIAARDILGKHALQLSDAVRSAQNFQSRIAAAERWLEAMLENGTRQDEIDLASRMMLATGGRTRIDALAERSGLSARHFQRRFAAQVGLAPKLYARTVRFDGALTMHRKNPLRSWTDIVHDAGYFDQAHFVRECHALVGAAPREFIGDWDNIFPLEV